MDDFRILLRGRLAAPAAGTTLSEGRIAKAAADLDLTLYRDLEVGQWVDQYTAVLFLDIRGFTRLSMALDVAETARILDAVLGAAAERLRAYGAHINDFPGDGIMAVFTEQDAGEPLEIHAQALFGASHLMEELSATLRDELLQVGIKDPVQVAIGLYSGGVRWQRIGAADCNRLMALGEVAPLAAKFATSDITNAWETMIGGPIAADVPNELRKQQKDFIRVYDGEEMSRPRWLLNTASLAASSPDLSAARRITEGARSARVPRPVAASLLGTVAPAVPRQGSGTRRDRGVG
jgi:class 3 adenylate cyclase